MTIAVLANFAVPTTDALALRDALLDLQRHAAQEPGTDLFEVHEDLDSAGEFVVFERYRDQDAVDAHRGSVAMAEFRSALKAIAARPEIRFLRPVLADPSRT
jgi:quinol monooxygenase YgiN